MEILISLACFWAAVHLSVHWWNQEQKRRREQMFYEQCRLRECKQVEEHFRNLLGQRGDGPDWDLVESQIAAGTSPSQLADIIASQYSAQDGFFLGGQTVNFLIGNSPRHRTINIWWPERLHPRHLYVVGKPGFGKTNLLCQLILQAINDGHGIVVFATELEMIMEELLPFITDRAEDVIYIDPSNFEKPISLNPLHAEEGERLDWIVSSLMTILENLFHDLRTGVRMRNIFRQAIKALVRIPNTTLFDIPKLLDRGDPTYRKWVISQVKDERLKSFWRHTYETYPPTAHHPVLNRLNEILDSPVLTNVLCANGPCFNFFEAMNTGKIVLVNLSDGDLGTIEARLLGQFIVSKLQIATVTRSSIPKAHRRRVYVFLDEFQTFVSSAPRSYEVMLERGRKYNVSMILAHQQTNQLPRGMLHEVLGCVSTLVVFRVSADDAGRLSKELLIKTPTEPGFVQKGPINPMILQEQRTGSAHVRLYNDAIDTRVPLGPRNGDRDVLATTLRGSQDRHGVSSQKEEKITAIDDLKDLDAGDIF
jgi:hypothetical protein